MSAVTERLDRRTRTARIVTEILAPIVLIVVLTVVVAVHAAGDVWAGLRYATVVIFFAGALPYAILILGVRRGRLGDRHLTKREERPLMMLIGLVSVVTGFVVMRATAAPAELFALVVAMVAGAAVALAVSIWWKISIHTACVSGSVAVLAMLVHPAMLALAPLVFLTGWARVILRDHSLSQVVAGGVVGALVASSIIATTL